MIDRRIDHRLRKSASGFKRVEVMLDAETQAWLETQAPGVTLPQAIKLALWAHRKDLEDKA